VRQSAIGTFARSAERAPPTARAHGWNASPLAIPCDELVATIVEAATGTGLDAVSVETLVRVPIADLGAWE
jgi:hypothetical protein